MLFHFRGFKRHFAALQIRGLENWWFCFFDVTIRLEAFKEKKAKKKQTNKKYDHIVFVFYNVQIFKRTFLRDEANHNIWHFCLFFCSGGSRAAKIASSKTFFRPFCKAKKKNVWICTAIIKLKQLGFKASASFVKIG